MPEQRPRKKLPLQGIDSVENGNGSQHQVRYNVVDHLAIVRLDHPPVNAMNLDLLGELVAAIQAANDDVAVHAAVIVGDGQFSAGADLALFEQIASHDDAVALSATFQEAFARIENSPKPVIAAISGRALGGGVELALACHARVAADTARFAMPEVTLDITPGAGGTQRLPRLVGLENALDLLLTGRTISAEEALKIGLVDRVCRAEQLLDAAQAMAAGQQPVRRSSELELPVLPEELRAACSAAVAKHCRHAELVAPKQIAHAVQVGLTEGIAAGERREQQAFAQCALSHPAQNKIYLFFARRQAAKAAEAARPAAGRVKRAAVLGTGTMGTGIAQALAAGRLHVALFDSDPAALRRAIERIRTSLDRQTQRGKLSVEQAERIAGRLEAAQSLESLAGVDLVIESVPENVDLKREVLARAESVAGPQAVIATNTSTIHLERLAGALERPERLVGLHFFNPAHHMPLVEVIRHRHTGAEVVALAVSVARQARKIPVVVNNREGFLVNRVFVPYLKEAFLLLEQGAAARQIDRAMVEFGFPMGPLQLADMAGLDILAATDTVLRGAFAHHRPASRLLERLVEAGRLGQKTSSGVYQYSPGDYTPEDDPALESFLRPMRGQSQPDMPPDSHQITVRLVFRLVVEALRVLEERLVERPADIDLAMVLGTGFPDFRGGPLRYAQQLPPGVLKRQLEQLAGRFGPRFAAPGSALWVDRRSGNEPDG